LNSPFYPPRLPAAFEQTRRRLGIVPTRFTLLVRIAPQTMWLFRGGTPRCAYRVSTSRFGIGQQAGSNCTPLGLHRIAEKIGAGQPIGTVFRGRRPVGLTWQGLPEATIVHRILWLEGLEPGFNRGGDVDSHGRYIYIHGFADETTLGRQMSHGCIHLAARDLVPLFDQLPGGTLIWISRE
jgi:hypothetical protein